MSDEYLMLRDIKTTEKTERILKTLPEYVTQYFNSKQRTKSELTRYAYIQDIRDFLLYLAPMHHVDIKTFPIEILSKLNAPDIWEYSNYLTELIDDPRHPGRKKQRFQNSTARRKLASVSSFYKFMINAGYFEKNPATSIEWPADKDDKAIIYLDQQQTAKLLNGILANDKQIYYKHKVNTSKARAPQFDFTKSSKENKEIIRGKVAQKDYDHIVKDIDDTTKNRREKVKIRNYLITALFLKTGIRVSELVNINLENVDLRNSFITVTGKGSKTRPVGYSDEMISGKMQEYIAKDRKTLAKGNYSEPALFLSTRGNRISVRQVEEMIKEMVQTYLYDDNTIPKNDFSPHKLRSTCATRLLKQTGNIKAVSDLLGHDGIGITAKKYAAIAQMENAEQLAEAPLTNQPPHVSDIGHNAK